MRARDWLLSKSSLSAGQARAHMLALQTGNGTLLVSSLAVYSEEPRFTVVSKPKRNAPRAEKPTVKPSINESGASEKNAFVLVKQNSDVCFSTQDEWFITSRSENSLVIHRAASQNEFVRSLRSRSK